MSRIRNSSSGKACLARPCRDGALARDTRVSRLRHADATNGTNGAN